MKKRFFAVMLAGILAVFAGCGANTETRSNSNTNIGTEAALPGEVPVIFDLPAGSCAEDFAALNLSNEYGLPILYTTDGSEPDENSPVYQYPIRLTPDGFSRKIEQASDQMYINDYRICPNDGSFPAACVIRAAVLMPDGTLGPVTSNTYFCSSDGFDCTVVSLITDPDNLLDHETGILVRGALYDQNAEYNAKVLSENEPKKVIANYSQKGKDWERESYVQIIDEGGTVSAEAPCGIRVRGNISRMYGQRSFNIYFRSDYGQETLACDLIPGNTDIEGNEITQYKSFVLRNGGNDTEQMKMKDSVLQALIREGAGESGTVSTQAYRPALVFLNGEYYGIESMIEKYSDEYIHYHYRIDRDNVIMIEDGDLQEGNDDDLQYYRELCAFADRDLTDPAVWEEFTAAADIDSMAEYYAAEIYIGNADWNETKNCWLWRTREEDGTPYGDARWRWMLYDLEFSSGMYGYEETDASHNTLEDALERCPLFASAMRNQEFRELFAAAVQRLAEKTLAPERTERKFRESFQEWSAYYEGYFKRFAGLPVLAKHHLNLTRSFFAKRPAYMEQYINGINDYSSQSKAKSITVE